MTATLRYEWRMQLRRPAFWTVMTVTTVLLCLLTAPNLPMLLQEEPRTAMIRAVIACNIPLPIGCAFLLADRLVRDERLGVVALLDATPSRRLGRLLGKYLGCVTATALPVAAVYLGFAAAYAVRIHTPQALPWALVMFAAITVPALLFVGAVSLCWPLVMPVAVFRVLFVGFWIWSSYLTPPKLVPTLNQTVFGPTGGYPIQVFFRYRGPHGGGDTDWAGPVPGALFNFLRPTPSPFTASLSIAAVVGLAVLTLLAAQQLRERRTG